MTSGTHAPASSSWLRRVAAHMPAWFVDASAGFVAGVLTSFIVLGLLTWKAETVAELTLGATPTCAAPRGLRQVEVVGAEAGSTQARYEDGPEDPKAVVGDPEGYFVASNAVDDATNTVWIPEIVNDTSTGATSREPEFLAESDANRLTLTLEPEADVRLVCVVNGNALWYLSYQNWGRVRTVQVWGDNGEKKLGTLQSLGSENFPNAQVAGRNLGDTRKIYLELVDAYAGIEVESFTVRACLDGAEVTADDGSEVDAEDWFETMQDVKLADHILRRWPAGCVLEPKVRAGIAEVRVYVSE